VGVGSRPAFNQHNIQDERALTARSFVGGCHGLTNWSSIETEKGNFENFYNKINFHNFIDTILMVR
jgi:hypothetical protein